MVVSVTIISLCTSGVYHILLVSLCVLTFRLKERFQSRFFLSVSLVSKDSLFRQFSLEVKSEMLNLDVVC